jgi:hypothetical protein
MSAIFSCVVLFFCFLNVLFPWRAVLLSVQSLRRSTLESAKTGIPSQLGRSSFGHGPEFSQVW